MGLIKSPKNKFIIFFVGISLTIAIPWDQTHATPQSFNLFEHTSLIESPIDLPRIVWFGQNNSTDLYLVGGKGASLSVLQNVPGIRIPEGFIITTHVYSQFIQKHPEIQKEIDLLDRLSDEWLHHMNKDLEEKIFIQSERVRKLILSSALSSEMQENIAKEYQKLIHLTGDQNLSVAVRSSGTAEDLPFASFAGQHDTFLNQKGEKQVFDSIIACWASLFHPHTVQYRNQLRLAIEKNDPALGETLKHTQSSIAVVIQRSLNSSASGVGFNVNPSGERKIHIEANYGLGETIVSGLTNPDVWETDPHAQTILFSVIGNKETKAVATEDGRVELLPITEIDRHRFSLSNEKVKEIANSIRDIGNYYQQKYGYQFIDTEFALDAKGVLYFVQARPETVFSSSHAVTIVGIPKNITANMIFHGGSTGYPGACTGKLVYAKTPQEALEKIKPGDILVTTKTTPNWTIVFPKLGGIIVDIGGVLSHTAIVGREHRIPTLLATADATKQLAKWDGKTVTLDSINSIVYEGTVKTIQGNLEDFIRLELQTSRLVQDLEMQIHRIDEEGKWMSRPNMPLTNMQLDFIQKAYDEISKQLELPLRYKVINHQIYVQIEDKEGHPAAYAQMTDTFLKWKLDRLESLFNHRTNTVQRLQEFAETFEPTPEKLLEFGQIYRDWMVHFLSRGRFGHGAVAYLMQEQMNKIPDPSILSSYLNFRYPMPNKSLEKEQEHARLAGLLLNLQLNKTSDPLHVKTKLQQEYPEIWRQIVAFAQDYEHEAAENMAAEISVDTVLKQLLMTLGDKSFNNTSPALTPHQVAQMDLLFAKNKDLCRIMVLAHRHLYQKENEHHIVAHAQHIIHQKLLALGQTLVEQGILKNPEQIFDFSIEEIAHMVEDSQTSLQSP